MVISLSPASAFVARLQSGLATPDDAILAVIAERARTGHSRAVRFFALIQSHALREQMLQAGMKYGGGAPPWLKGCHAIVRQLRSVRAGGPGSGHRVGRQRRRPRMQGVAS
jgi:hypothetical protein